jgi:imidazole glycerol-phosphate synthase subunit HisH
VNITIVGYGVGNIGAIPNMLRRLGADASVTSDPDRIRKADKLILPGVGAFDAAMARLRELDLVDVLDEQVRRGVPVLGVCLGMELLANGSDEGVLDGLGWVPGHVTRFGSDVVDAGLRIPHMGWNYVTPVTGLPLLRGFGHLSRFYFAHSYYFAPAATSDVAATTTYGFPFASVVHHDNVTGIQFHPEKSHRFGLQLFENFLAD